MDVGDLPFCVESVGDMLLKLVAGRVEFSFCMEKADSWFDDINKMRILESRPLQTLQDIFFLTTNYEKQLSQENGIWFKLNHPD